MVGFPFATAPTTITMGLSLLIFYANFFISINLAFVENAILGASAGKCKVTGDFTIYKSVVEDYYALIDNLLRSWAKSALNLL